MNQGSWYIRKPYFDSYKKSQVSEGVQLSLQVMDDLWHLLIENVYEINSTHSGLR